MSRMLKTMYTSSVRHEEGNITMVASSGLLTCTTPVIRSPTLSVSSSLCCAVYGNTAIASLRAPARGAERKYILAWKGKVIVYETLPLTNIHDGRQSGL